MREVSEFFLCHIAFRPQLLYRNPAEFIRKHSSKYLKTKNASIKYLTPLTSAQTVFAC